METPANEKDPLLESVEAYGKTTLELFKLKLLASAINVVTSLVSKLTVIAVFSMFILFGSIGIGFWLGEVLGKVHYGFFIVGGFYLVAGLLFAFFLRKWVEKPVSTMIIKQALQ